MAKKEQDLARKFFMDLQKTPLKPVYFFYGEERYLIDQAIQMISKKMFGKQEPDPFRYELLHASESSARKILSAVRIISMVGGSRLIVVREIHLLPDSDVELIAAYAAKPVSKSHLILATSGKVNARKKVWKTLKKASVCVAFTHLYQDQMPDWITRQGKRQGFKIDPAAASYLADAIGTDMASANRALEKVFLGTSKGQRWIGLDEVRHVVAQTRERGIFELTNALSSRDMKKSLFALQSLMEQGEPAIKIGFMIARHLRILLRVKAAKKQNLSPSELASEAGVSPYFLKDYLKGVDQFSLGELVSLVHKSFKTDQRLKSSRLPNEMILQDLVMAISPPRG